MNVDDSMDNTRRKCTHFIRSDEKTLSIDIHNQFALEHNKDIVTFRVVMRRGILPRRIRPVNPDYS